MAGRLFGKVALITGAARGIGRATAECFHREGARLVLNDINEASLQELANHLDPAEQVALVPGDISKEETAQKMAQKAKDKFGKIDILVNNAGIHYIKDISDITDEDIDRCFGVNLKSAIFCTKAVLPYMLDQKSGAIINLSSISGFIGQEMFDESTFLYNMTKAALAQMARSMATRYAAEGIRVNAVAPGAVRTNQVDREIAEANMEPDQFWELVGGVHPIGRVASAHEIANAILFLASDEASFVTGETLVVDGGYLAR